MRTYEDGLAEGKDIGYDIGYTEGLLAAERDYDDGYVTGYDEGLEVGYEDGINERRYDRRNAHLIVEELFRVTRMMKDRDPTFHEIAEVFS